MVKQVQDTIRTPKEDTAQTGVETSRDLDLSLPKASSISPSVQQLRAIHKASVNLHKNLNNIKPGSVPSAHTERGNAHRAQGRRAISALESAEKMLASSDTPLEGEQLDEYNRAMKQALVTSRKISAWKDSIS